MFFNMGASILTIFVFIYPAACSEVDVEFVDAPINQYPVFGTNYIVKCKVKGNPYPVIDWYRGDQLINEDSGKYFRKPDGLYISNVAEQDDGIYKCSAMVASTGAYKIQNIKVEVLIPPRILPIKEISIVEGETASVKCSATGKPPPTYTWIKLDRRHDISKTDRFGVKNQTGELIMNRVEFGNNGMYKCLAENPAGRAETIVNITVLVKPNIYELWNVTHETGGNTRIICKAKGRPAPRITFRKLSNAEPYQLGIQEQDPRIALEQEFFEEEGEAIGTLSISNLARHDDGLYQCIAENPTATAYKNGHLTIWFKPTFNRTRDSAPVWSWDGRPGNLTCLPEAIPNATIVWRWNEFEISEENFDNNIFQRNNFQVIGRSPYSVLIVKPNDSPWYYTSYECIARNPFGEASISIRLKERFVPEVFNQERPDTITATTIKFEIVPPNNYDGLPIRTYSVQYKPESQPSWDRALMHTWSAGSPYILKNLIPEWTYNFRFSAESDVGREGWTNVYSLTMPWRSEPAEPSLLLSSPVSRNLSSIPVVISPYSNRYELRWNAPADNGKPIEYYSVRYCAIEQNNDYRDRDCSENIEHSVQYTNFQLKRLTPDTLYKVELRARNDIGNSSPAQIWLWTSRAGGQQCYGSGVTCASFIFLSLFSQFVLF